MAYIIKKEKNYKWPVTISEPMDGGGFTDHKVNVRFKMLSQERIDEVVKNESENDTDILRDVLMGWDDGEFKDEAGNNLPFNKENKDIVLSVPFIRSGLIKGFFESITGKAAKRKN
jgi:hypothetical protein